MVGLTEVTDRDAVAVAVAETSVGDGVAVALAPWEGLAEAVAVAVGKQTPYADWHPAAGEQNVEDVPQKPKLLQQRPPLHTRPPPAPAPHSEPWATLDGEADAAGEAVAVAV